MYGVNNLRLQLIEEGFPEVKVIARGEELKIKGEEEKVDKLKAILGSIFEEIRRKGRISENKFNEMLLPSEREERNDFKLAPDDTVLVHGSGGLVIKPKNRGPDHRAPVMARATAESER